MNAQIKVRVRSQLGRVPELAGQALEELLDESAERVAGKWRGSVRVRSGAYRDSVTAVNVGKGKRLVQSDVKHSVFNEYGTSHMAAQPDARRAVEAEPAEIRRSAKRKKIL